MHIGVGLPAGVGAARLGDLDSLRLPVAPGFVVVTRSLQGDSQQHVLYAAQHDLRNAGSVRRQLGQVNHARDGEPRALGLDSLDQAFGIGERQARDAVELFGNDDFAGLQIGDQAQ